MWKYCIVNLNLKLGKPLGYLLVLVRIILFYSKWGKSLKVSLID